MADIVCRLPNPVVNTLAIGYFLNHSVSSFRRLMNHPFHTASCPVTGGIQHILDTISPDGDRLKLLLVIVLLKKIIES